MEENLTRNHDEHAAGEVADLEGAAGAGTPQEPALKGVVLDPVAAASLPGISDSGNRRTGSRFSTSAAAKEARGGATG